MFLKRIELSGFKSFANKTVLLMEDGITGIVGPNGCGKSNINDAIRWVLGEQSSKSLRSGTSMSDIIFSGSESRKPVNLARVTLVFDNTKKVFDSPFDEIEISREIHRDGTTSCYINKTPCRLKDISDLVMDTGMGRDSLSIISQGNISSFADAKPIERRSLFEEAAGVAKYKKRKKTSLQKLEGMESNLERVQDLVDSLSEQMESLQEQAEKARQYLECKEELTSIEISTLAMQIEEYQKQAAAIRQSLSEDQLSLNLLQSSLKEKEDQLDSMRKELFELDSQAASLQNEYAKMLEESYGLQRRKVELDEKRKYALEQADLQMKMASLQEMASEAGFEYEDRKKRLLSLQEDLRNLEASISQDNQSLQAMNSRLHKEQAQNQALQNRKLIVENKLSNPYAHKQGIQAVLKARHSLSGIEGTVDNLLEPVPGYETAISIALGSSADQIVTKDEESAKAAIRFLKKASAGRATFLPLSVCRPRSLRSDQQTIAQSQPGMLGAARDFVNVSQQYGVLAERLLGNILVCDDLDHASHLANMLRHSVKIVTLQGDVIHSGGAMSGGSIKNNASSGSVLRKELKEISEELQKQSISLYTSQNRIRQCQESLQKKREKQVQLRIDIEKLASIAKVKEEKFHSLQDELNSLNHNSQVETKIAQDSLVSQIASLHERMDAAQSEISLKRGRRMEQSEKAQDLESSLRNLRREMSSISSGIHKKEIELAKLETRIEQSLMRLNTEYSLTFEAARAQMQPVDLKEATIRIKQLRQAMNKLGDVNLKAPAQYEEIAKKYSFLTSQKQELEQAAAQIRNAIAEMDATMTIQFKEMFDKINSELDGIFKAMFGGGKASLSLEDPDDILNTGIDIDVQPPGKMVKNIQTFSGGEKALIAISVLFAILKARTMPLCIFDEVEAALDQANVERFARYLSHFKDESQFIVVTHRPGTMEQCDTLYGITMQKDGVSTVLKVMLRDAIDMTKGKE